MDSKKYDMSDSGYDRLSYEAFQVLEGEIMARLKLLKDEVACPV